jgi:hypothetical protein
MRLRAAVADVGTRTRFIANVTDRLANIDGFTDGANERVSTFQPHP